LTGESGCSKNKMKGLSEADEEKETWTVKKRGGRRRKRYLDQQKKNSIIKINRISESKRSLPPGKSLTGIPRRRDRGNRKRVLLGGGK